MVHDASFHIQQPPIFFPGAKFQAAGLNLDSFSRFCRVLVEGKAYFEAAVTRKAI
jgi:hypothetical protein